MIKGRNLMFILLLAFIFTFGFIMSGCSSEATVEQLQKIKDLESEINSLDQSIKTKEGEKANIESDISNIESKLEECNKETELVKQRLSTWKEPVKEPVEQPVQKPSKKKRTK